LPRLVTSFETSRIERMLTMISTVQNLRDRALELLHKLAWVGPLLVRLTLGVVFTVAGWGKLHNLDNITEFFASLHIPAPGIQAAFVSTLEFAGGLLLIAGLGTRIVSALLIGVMTVAILTAKLPDLHGVVDLANTIELTYLVMFAWLVVSGAGAASLDHVIARRGQGVANREAERFTERS
jgi:putative oxidoreductase